MNTPEVFAAVLNIYMEWIFMERNLAMTYKCARCGSPVHDYDERDNRAACEKCQDWCPVVEEKEQDE